ncbi:putative bromodomain protein [Trichinella spiralis]|uniref:putative bromodomain protein n=1 Tax=Trichinella spiralis TaxID=6334 RepID=UPI0001EFC87A|nr:putative bromodomain protein [Trichinella spiralis]
MTRKPFDQLMNALPLERTEPAVGIDFDPPILARGVGACYCFIKCWCACNHFEIIADITVHSFLRALCWFILLRGRSKLMPSENFRSFHLTRCLQPQDTLALERIEWKLIAELAPWCDGALGEFCQSRVPQVLRLLPCKT